MEVDRVRAGDERAVVGLGIEDLHGEGFPTAGRSAIDESRPALADAAKLALDSRDQLGLDCIAVRTQIRRIHGVRVVVIRICMLQLHDQHAWRAWRNPRLVVLVGLLLLYAVVARKVKALRVIWLQAGIRWSLAEVGEAGYEVVVENDQGIVRLRMGAEA